MDGGRLVALNRTGGGRHSFSKYIEAGQKEFTAVLTSYDNSYQHETDKMASNYYMYDSAAVGLSGRKAICRKMRASSKKIEYDTSGCEVGYVTIHVIGIKR